MMKSLLLLMLCVSLSACASAWDTRPIAQKHGEALARLSPGMSVSEFRQIMPTAFLKGQSFIGGMRVDAYAIIWRHTEHRMGDRVTEELWFYFRDGKLIKWGAPNDWPAPAELRVELLRRP